MTQQPDALLLAEKLEQQFPVGTAQRYLDGEAAAELRRIHAVNAMLLEALIDLSGYVSLAPYEVQRKAIDAIAAAKEQA